MEKIIIICEECKQEFEVPKSKHEAKKRLGQKRFYCSSFCSKKSKHRLKDNGFKRHGIL